MGFKAWISSKSVLHVYVLPIILYMISDVDKLQIGPISAGCIWYEKSSVRLPHQMVWFCFQRKGVSSNSPTPYLFNHSGDISHSWQMNRMFGSWYLAQCQVRGNAMGLTKTNMATNDCTLFWMRRGWTERTYRVELCNPSESGTHSVEEADLVSLRYAQL